MSILGSQTLIDPVTSFYIPQTTPSVTTSLPGFIVNTAIPDGGNLVVYQLPVDGSSPNTPDLTPGYYLYTFRITLTDITWSTTTGGNLQFVLEYTENSVLAARRVFRCFVNTADEINPEVSFTIGIPMVNPQNLGNIAIKVFNKTGADIASGFTVTVNQYNFTKVSTEVSVVSL